MSPILTLAIPSRQLPDTLISGLIKIRDEVESQDLVGFVEVLVSLNPPVPLETIPQQLAELVRNCGRVIKTPSDLTYDEHMDFLVKEARGRWVKFLADDDELNTGALVMLKKIVAEHPNLKCLVHDFEYWQPIDSPIQLWGLNNLKRGQMPGPWGQVSTTLFSRDSWLTAPTLENSNYIHSFKFEYIASMNLTEALYLSQELVKVRPGAPNFSATPFIKALVSSQALGVIRELKEYDADAFLHPRRIRSDIVYFLRTVAYARANGARNLLPLCVKAVRLWPTYFWTWVAIPICTTPRFVLNLLRRKAVS